MKFAMGLARFLLVPAIGFALFLASAWLCGVPPAHIAGLGLLVLGMALVFAWASCGGEL